MNRALVHVSPAAGRGGDATLRDRLKVAIEQSLARRGLAADFPASASAPEAAAVLPGAADKGYDLAVVAGGDGTVRLAVHALAGTGPPLAIVPLGTGNLLAATLGVPRDPFAAAERIADAQPVTIDTGRLEADGVSESFAVAAGVGLDARVMAGTSRGAKARFGILAYFATVLRMLPSLPVTETEIVVDDKIYELTTVAVFVANCGQIVPGLLGPRAPLDPTDGLLDVVAIKSGPLPSGLTIAVGSALDSLLRAEPGEGGRSMRLQGQRIKVTTRPPEPIQIDGDILPLGGGSFQAIVQPRSLTVLI